VHAVPQRAHGGGDNNSRVGAASRGEAEQLCGRGGARRGGAGTTVVERKASGRPSGEEGVQETWRSAVVVMVKFFSYKLWCLEGSG
jgi:hypothetical protein